MPKKIDINQLIKKAKEKNEKAFNVLLNTYWSDIYRFQLSKNKTEDDAEDITIKTFSRAFDKIHLYNEKYNFKTWLLTISNHIFIDYLRKQKPEVVSIDKKEFKAHLIFDDTPTAEDQLIIKQNLAELLFCIKKLKPHYQEVINLRYFSEMSYIEIAETLKEPIGNVKVKLLRARRLLADIIKKNKRIV